jgi:hypothetical protein
MRKKVVEESKHKHFTYSKDYLGLAFPLVIEE